MRPLCRLSAKANALCLVREGSATLLSRLTFNFSIVDGRLALAVGGLQGPKAGHKHEVIDATRDLHGLRPKDATPLAASAIADGLDASVHAVGDGLHVYPLARYLVPRFGFGQHLGIPSGLH